MLFAIADTHLSIATGKTMGVFSGWKDYEKRLESNWRRLIGENDTVILPGDISWSMHLKDAAPDFAFLDSLPGQKIIMKGNHDYWWSTIKKCKEYFAQNSFDTLDILHNNSFVVGNIAVCGTRGWFFDAETDLDKKIVLREAGRLRTSIQCAKESGKELVVFLHYPPLNRENRCEEIYSVLLEEEIKRCYYGHLHSYAHTGAFIGKDENGIEFNLISADYLNFCPLYIPESLIL